MGNSVGRGVEVWDARFWCIVHAMEQCTEDGRDGSGADALSEVWETVWAKVWRCGARE